MRLVALAFTVALITASTATAGPISPYGLVDTELTFTLSSVSLGTVVNAKFDVLIDGLHLLAGDPPLLPGPVARAACCGPMPYVMVDDQFGIMLTPITLSLMGNTPDYQFSTLVVNTLPAGSLASGSLTLIALYDATLTHTYYTDADGNAFTRHDLTGTIGLRGPTSQVPEPATWVLLSAGLAVTAISRMSRRPASDAK